MNRHQRRIFYSRLIEQAPSDPVAALDETVLPFLRAQSFVLSNMALAASVEILAHHYEQIVSDPNISSKQWCLLDAVEALIICPDNLSDQGNAKMIKNNEGQLTEYLYLQGKLIEFACKFLKDPRLPSDHKKYTMAEEIIDNIPEVHHGHKIVKDVLNDIAVLNPAAIHLCPYRHYSMEFDRAILSINRVGIPDKTRYGCLMGMMELSRKEKNDDKSRKLFIALEDIRMKQPDSEDFGYHLLPAPVMPTQKRRMKEVLPITQ